MQAHPPDNAAMHDAHKPMTYLAPPTPSSGMECNVMRDGHGDGVVMIQTGADWPLPILRCKAAMGSTDIHDGYRSNGQNQYRVKHRDA